MPIAPRESSEPLDQHEHGAEAVHQQAGRHAAEQRPSLGPVGARAHDHQVEGLRALTQNVDRVAFDQPAIDGHAV